MAIDEIQLMLCYTLGAYPWLYGGKTLPSPYFAKPCDDRMSRADIPSGVEKATFAGYNV